MIFWQTSNTPHQLNISYCSCIRSYVLEHMPFQAFQAAPHRKWHRHTPLTYGEDKWGAGHAGTHQHGLFKDWPD